MRWYCVLCFRASFLKNSTLRLLKEIVTFTPSSRKTRSSGRGRKSGTTSRSPRGSSVYRIFSLIDSVSWKKLVYGQVGLFEGTVGGDFMRRARGDNAPA